MHTLPAKAALEARSPGEGAASATLPFTGLNVFWLVLAGFTLLAAAAALLRIVPTWHRRRS